jgi:hypothetical protein
MADNLDFADVAYLSVIESAANTLTFGALSLARALRSRQAFIVHKVEYLIPAATLALVVAAADALQFGLSLSNSITDIGYDKVEVFDRVYLPYDGTLPAGGLCPPQPIVHKFTDMPGGGHIVPVKTMYLYAKGSSLAAATTASCRMWYTVRDLKDSEYLQLVEAYEILK